MSEQIIEDNIIKDNIEPVVKEPVVKEPVIEEPVIEEPVEEPVVEEEEVLLKLGDIILITDPTNEILNNNVFLIEYIDEQSKFTCGEINPFFFLSFLIIILLLRINSIKSSLYSKLFE